MKSVLILGAAAALLASCTAQPKKENSSAEIQKPNVIFLVADDIGFGDFSCNGATEISTPNVDKLASQGVRFTDAHAVAATSTPSRYSLFTGHYAWRRNDTGIAAGNAGMVIRPEQPTVADMFQSCGYATGAVGKWHLGLANKTGEQDWNGFITPGPKDIGFEYSYIMAATGDRVPCCWVENQRIVNLDPNDPIEVSYTTPFPGEPLGKDHPELLTKFKPSVNHGHDQAIVNGISRIGYMKGGEKARWKDEEMAERFSLKVKEFIAENKDRPFFLYYGLHEPHVPRVPAARFAGSTPMGPRGDAIAEADWCVGELLSYLDSLEILENTLIIFSSDNGPVLDDGYADGAVELAGDHKPAGGLRGGKYSLFDGGTHVPMFVYWKGHTVHSESDALVSQLDFLASLAALTGAVIPDGLDSENCLDALLGRKGAEGRSHLVSEADGRLALRSGDWSMLPPYDGPERNITGNTWTRMSRPLPKTAVFSPGSSRRSSWTVRSSDRSLKTCQYGGMMTSHIP